MPVNERGEGDTDWNTPYICAPVTLRHDKRALALPGKALKPEGGRSGAFCATTHDARGAVNKQRTIAHNKAILEFHARKAKALDIYRIGKRFHCIVSH